MRCVITRANRQPAVADIVTFDGSLFGWFGPPQQL